MFESESAAAECCKAIETRLAGETRLPVTVVLKTPAELSAVIRRNPFLQDKRIDHSKLHVTFLASAVTKDGLSKLSALKAGSEQFQISGSVVYLHCPNGYGNTKLSNGALEKALSVRATTRNWNTVNRLYEMAGPISG